MSELYSASISLSFSRKTWHNLGAHCTVKVKMTTYRNLFLFPAAYRSKAAAVAIGCKLTQSEKRRRDLKRIVFKYKVRSQSFGEKLTDLSGPFSTWCFFVAERALTVRSGVLGWSACPSREKHCTCVLFTWQKYLDIDCSMIDTTPLLLLFVFCLKSFFFHYEHQTEDALLHTLFLSLIIYHGSSEQTLITEMWSMSMNKHKQAFVAVLVFVWHIAQLQVHGDAKTSFCSISESRLIDWLETMKQHKEATARCTGCWWRHLRFSKKSREILNFEALKALRGAVQKKTERSEKKVLRLFFAWLPLLRTLPPHWELKKALMLRKKTPGGQGP